MDCAYVRAVLYQYISLVLSFVLHVLEILINLSTLLQRRRFLYADASSTGATGPAAVVEYRGPLSWRTFDDPRGTLVQEDEPLLARSVLRVGVSATANPYFVAE
jgi:hypothetical protein